MAVEVVMTRLKLRIMESSSPAYMIAARIGISPSRLSEYSLGRRPLPKKHLIPLSRVLNCNPEDIVGVEEVAVEGIKGGGSRCYTS